MDFACFLFYFPFVFPILVVFFSSNVVHAMLRIFVSV